MLDAHSDSNDFPTPNGSAEKRTKSKPLKIAAALSTVLWIVGFVLPFVIPANSKFVWVSDTMLLIGFWPLLFFYRAGWPWVVFGVLNTILGFGLELSRWLLYYLPKDFWTPERMPFKPGFERVYEHMITMHPSLPWILIGIASTIYGVFRITKTIVKWSIKAATKTK